ncbi:hypothetical protein [Zobellia galactanivorans]|uniref:hypothetical protein n=1 Tax=Zobellia galactanivorans (strain DSM 12802 / CCUG 47099 / CIP 106680 / NCIMB 13871 / Dsij) TaxID=63186 RepID=UPI001C06EAD4|nr:hypothetical protein [Zobellia galactanivorans]MBU3025507.1 hypothetical protein [Zobellia galactanivorans]
MFLNHVQELQTLSVFHFDVDRPVCLHEGRRPFDGGGVRAVGRQHGGGPCGGTAPHGLDSGPGGGAGRLYL